MLLFIFVGFSPVWLVFFVGFLTLMTPVFSIDSFCGFLPVWLVYFFIVSLFVSSPVWLVYVSIDSSLHFSPVWRVHFGIDSLLYFSPVWLVFCVGFHICMVSAFQY